MIQKQSFNVIKGMRQDISPSKANPEYVFDARNIRLTARGNDTLLSISNEQGTQECKSSDNKPLIKGIALGYCVLNKYLIVFTREKVSGVKIEYITRIYYQNNEWKSDILYSSHYVSESEGGSIITETCGNLNFGDSVQTLGIYENENIQKVYWVDGINQPRVINIVKDILINKSVADVKQSYTNTSFDFVPELSLKEEVTITPSFSQNGEFTAGTIQYAFTYYNKYSQETNIFYTTDLYYITYPNRGGSPEDKINTSFQIKVENLQYEQFDYIRIYSIHRSSLNATPYVKRIIDLPTKSLVDSKQYTEGVYVRYSGTPYVSINNGSYRHIYSYGDYLQYDIMPIVNGETAGSHAASSNYYVFPKTVSPKVKLADGRIIGISNGDTLFVTTETGVNGPGDPMQPIIVIDNLNDSRLKITTKTETSEYILYTDNNTIGESIDPTLLLYIGGEDIIASSIAQKDNTLFLGDITINRPAIHNAIKEVLNSPSTPLEVVGTTRRIITKGSIGSYYKYSNQNSVENPTTFKIGEHYRLGVQFQHKSGKWSEPVLINSAYTVQPKYKNNTIDIRPKATYFSNAIYYDIPKLSIDLPDLGAEFTSEFKRARAVIVNPTLQDRKIVMQGMLCPTVYTENNRANNTPYSQSSWFLRPFNNDTATVYSSTGAVVSSGNGATLQYLKQNGECEIQKEEGANEYGVEIEYAGTSTEDSKDLFKVSQDFLTFHSPDIEFDSSIQSLDQSLFRIRTVGRIQFDTSIGDINIQTSSPPIGGRATGFVHSMRKTRVPAESARSLVAGWFYKDWIVDDNDGRFEAYNKQTYELPYFVCPWQSSGSLNNDIVRPANSGARSAVLKRKVISNIKTSFNNKWEDSNDLVSADTQIGIFNSNEVSLLRINEKNYYGNVDTLIVPSQEFSKVVSYNGATTIAKLNGWGFNDATSDLGDNYESLRKQKASIRMKYKSTPHAVFQINPPLEPTDVKSPFLYMAEIYRYSVTNPFGGDSESSLKANLWIPSGPSVPLKNSESTTIEYLHGDCFYQRYDCLKTYPFTNEDENSIVEIGSFMIETRVNIDGRYDRNRGLDSNLHITPQNFNLLNNVYSQQDNFFNYRVLDKDFYKLNNFPNSITWSKEKLLGEDVDTWTNITMTNVLDLDGDKGKLNAIKVYNNELYAFQDKGVSNILFNNRVQIPTSDNVPIEISNGYKVQGKRYLSNSVGCQNQRAVISTPNGIYFSDLYNSGIYLLNGQGLQDISTPRGFTNWVKKCKPTKLHYDTNNSDLYLIGDGYPYDLDPSKNLSYRNCLCFSEKLNEFTSFMDYDYTDFMFNIDDSFYAINIKSLMPNSISGLYKMFEGEYNNFFDSIKPYHISYISNQNPTNDKIFNTVEFRADTLKEEDKLLSSDNIKSPNICPFNKITVWNEYQEGVSTLNKIWGKPSSLKEKFRIWRVNIPRDKTNNRDRIRNPWVYIKLEGGNNTDRMQLHDLQVYYYDNSIYGYGNQR